MTIRLFFFSRRLFIKAPFGSVFTIFIALSLFAGHPVSAEDIMSFKLFDGHPHLIADDTAAYPRLEPLPDGAHRPGNPNGFGGIGAGLPAGSGGQPSAKVPNPVRALPDATRMVQWMDDVGVAGAAAIQKRGTYGLDNSYILDSAVRFPEKFMPVVILDPVDENTPDLLRKMIQENGLAGIRLTGQAAADGSFPWLESSQALKTWEVAEEAGLVMDLMIFETGNFPDIVALLERFSKDYPNVRIVLDHALFPPLEGAPDFGIDDNFKALSKLSNVFYKVTIINLDMLREAEISAVDFMRRLVDVYGADHVLWGSDIGNSAGTYEEIVGRIVASTAKLSDDEKRAVLHDTGASVFIRGGSRGGE